MRQPPLRSTATGGGCCSAARTPRPRWALAARGGRGRGRAVRVCGPDAAHLRLDLRVDRVDLVVRTPAAGGMSRLDVTLAARISAAVGELGLATRPGARRGAPRAGDGDRHRRARHRGRAALLAGGVRLRRRDPTDRRGHEEVIVVDPAGQGPPSGSAAGRPTPATQPDPLRPDRRRGRGRSRVAAALSAGGRLVSDAQARAFWILATGGQRGLPSHCRTATDTQVAGLPVPA